MAWILYLLFFILVAVLLLCVAIELYHRFSRTASLINKIPGPEGALLIGNVPVLLDTPIGIFDKLRKWAKEYPPIYKLWSSNAFYAVMIWAPEDMQIVLSNISHHKKSEMYELLQEWLGDGLLRSSGEKWLHRRRIITPTFHFNVLKRYISVFNYHANEFVNDLKDDLNAEINILPHLHKSSLHTIAEAAMGSIIKDKESEKKYRHSVQRMGDIAVYRILRPWNYFYINAIFSKQFYEERFLLRYLRNFTKNVIDEREKIFNEEDVIRAQDDDDNDDIYGGKKRRRLALLDLLISAKNHNEITYEGIREEIDTFMFEGHDTVAMAMQFMLMLIANNPDCQEKLYEEVTSILQDGREPTYEDLHQMTYMEMVIKESMRLYPSVPLISRKSGVEFTTHSGYVIPSGSVLVLNIFDTHRLESIYPEPEKFIPERFSPENSKNRHPYAYLPFSAGGRNCIGQKYAMLNMKCKLAAIVRNLILLPVDSPETIKLQCDIILRTQEGIKIKVKPRK